MENYWAILALGIIIGMSLGSYVTALARPQKQWLELTGKEKKIRMWVITAAVVLLICGVVIGFLNYK
jgi:accessory gene regulator protein AgrB